MVTGPVLGSVELLPILSAATGVVLVIERGRSRSRMNDALESLREAGVWVQGLVLNRADAYDCNHYARGTC